MSNNGNLSGYTGLLAFLDAVPGKHVITGAEAWTSDEQTAVLLHPRLAAAEISFDVRRPHAPATASILSVFGLKSEALAVPASEPQPLPPPLGCLVINTTWGTEDEPDFTAADAGALK